MCSFKILIIILLESITIFHNTSSIIIIRDFVENVKCSPLLIWPSFLYLMDSRRKYNLVKFMMLLTSHSYIDFEQVNHDINL